jgi:hypothetical protein
MANNCSSWSPQNWLNLTEFGEMKKEAGGRRKGVELSLALAWQANSLAKTNAVHYSAAEEGRPEGGQRMSATCEAIIFASHKSWGCNRKAHGWRQAHLLLQPQQKRRGIEA